MWRLGFTKRLKNDMKNFVLATTTLVGAIVGLGIFGIPYTAARAGFFIGVIYIVILGIVALLIQLLYGEIVERTEGKHRLTGYTEKYLGKGWKKVLGVFIVSGIYISLLAYIIVGGKFISLLLPDVLNPVVWGLVFWFVLSLAVLRGMKTVAWIELLMTGPLILFIFVIFILGFGDISYTNLTSSNLKDIFLPYGVVLFAIFGSVAIPEVREILKKDSVIYKRVIIVGSIVPVIIYILFTFLVVGISGPDTSQEALEGLVPYFGFVVMALGAAFGVFALSTSYLILGLNLKHTFQYDWKMSKHIAGLLTITVPAVLFIAGFQQFITIISISGAVIGASIGIVILAIYRKVKKLGDKKPGYELHVPSFIVYALMILFALGGLYEIIYLIW